jgi:hemerythrin-like domain-containing protein
MAQMHNSIFRGYNSIYLQAPYIRETEKSDFIGYCLTWYKLVETHAKDEESNLFPLVEELLGDKVFAETHKEHGVYMSSSRLDQQVPICV